VLVVEQQFHLHRQWVFRQLAVSLMILSQVEHTIELMFSLHQDLLMCLHYLIIQQLQILLIFLLLVVVLVEALNTLVAVVLVVLEPQCQKDLVVPHHHLNHHLLLPLLTTQ
jgi:hypothetical protein